MRLIQLLKFKKWETRLFKMPHLETPRFQTGMRVTVASGHFLVRIKFSMELLLETFINPNTRNLANCARLCTIITWETM